MSRDWTPEELQAASREMKAAGHMSFEEFCEELERANQAGATSPGTTRKENIMEEVFVYRVDPPIEGVAEIRAARAASVNYHQAKMEFERGEREYEQVPKNNPGEVDALRKKYPRAAAYLEAERWASTGDPIKVRLGTRGMEKIQNGEDPDEVLAYMSRELDAFRMAQEG